MSSDVAERLDKLCSGREPWAHVKAVAAMNDAGDAIRQLTADLAACQEREARLREALEEARPLLACGNCENGPHVVNVYGEIDECPACQGEHRNSTLVKQIDATLAVKP